MIRATRSTRQFNRRQLSTEASADIIRALGAWREAYSLTDYDLADLAGVSRDTIGRWRRRPTSLPAKTVERLIVGIEEYAETASATRAELERLLTIAQEAFAVVENDPAEKLRRRLNAQGLRGNSVLAEIEASGFFVVQRETNGRN
jgi:transcriptional regulator with XRE-family HTH domain